MVPSSFVLLNELPRTHNGKLDRKALPPPTRDETASRGIIAPPRSPTEEMIMGVFRTVLDRSDFGIFDNFFDLGGHSLMAARLMAKLRTVSGVDVPLRDLFARPTVAGLAEAVDALQWVQQSPIGANAAGVREEFVL
jgi:acyl carrier protein